MKKRYSNFGTRRLRPLLPSFFLFSFVSFSTANPKVLAPGSFFTQGPSASAQLALTFDDGPGPETEKFLELLKKYNVKATFFLLGEQVRLRPKIAAAIVAQGHEVASHTMVHTNYLKRFRANEKENPTQATEKTRHELVADMENSKKIIEKETGQKTILCRMPHGIDRPWIKEAAKEVGFVLVNWTFGGDWLNTPQEELKKGYVKAVKPGAILLFHDAGTKKEKSLALTEAVIKAAREKNLKIVTVGELLSS